MRNWCHQLGHDVVAAGRRRTNSGAIGATIGPVNAAERADGTDMGKASKGKEDFSRREKIAAQRAAAKRAEQRRNGLFIAGGAVIVVIAVVVAFIVVKTNKSTGSTPTASASVSGAPTGSALTSVVNTVTSVPTSATDAVGNGGVTGPQTISPAGPSLTSSGKPELLYIGAEYCPYCAAERWGMVVALSRFGTFSGLAPMRSSSIDQYPNTATWTFAHSTYTSSYLSFSPVEMYTNIPLSSGQGYTTLQTPTSAQNALFAKYDAPPYVQSTSDDESYPFLDFANKYVIVGSSYSPQVLSGLTWSQIASDLSSSSSAVAKAVNGTANYITATICKLTGNQPATACTSAVQSLESSIK